MNIYTDNYGGGFRRLIAKCLVLDHRYEYFADYIEPTAREFGIEVEPFIVGRAEELVFPTRIRNCLYNRIDDGVLPPHLPGSTTYPTWTNKPYAYDAWKSHRQMILDSLRAGHENVLFLEDDIIFEDEFKTVFNQLEEENIGKFSMLYLGSYNALSSSGERVGDNLIKLESDHCAGFHGVILNCSIYEKLLRMPPLGPWDWMCHKYLRPRIDGCYAVYPPIITQKDNNYSYIESCTLRKPSRYD